MPGIEKVIDIRKEFKESNSRFLRSFPDFMLKAFEKLICQDELNATIRRSSDKTGVPFIRDVLKEWNVNVIVNGSEKIPSKGSFIFVANHPIGGLDGLAFFSLIFDHFPNVISPSNNLLMRIPNLRPLMLGINVFGKNTRETIIELEQLFKSEAQILIFPSGEVSRRENGIIADKIWHKTFISKAIQHKRDIMPVHISGKVSGLFYTIANLRESLGIKMFIESILLPREMLKLRNSSLTLTIGDKIAWQTLTSDKSHSEWAQYIKEMVYKLPATKQKTGSYVKR
jgi:putative hemolysin